MTQSSPLFVAYAKACYQLQFFSRLSPRRHRLMMRVNALRWRCACSNSDWELAADCLHNAIAWRELGRRLS